MGISSDFLTILYNEIGSTAFKSSLPTTFSANCLIVDGTAEIMRWLHSKSNRLMEFDPNLNTHIRLYKWWEEDRKIAWRSLFTENPTVLGNVNLIVCLLDSDDKIPICKSVERQTRSYDAYKWTDLVGLNMLEQVIDPVDPEGDDQSYKLKSSLTDVGMWGDTKKIWATRTLRNLVKSKYCQIMMNIFGSMEFAQYIYKIQKSITTSSGNGDNNNNSKNNTILNANRISSESDDMAIVMRETDHLPLVYLDGIKKVDACPDVCLESLEAMEEVCRSPLLELRQTSPETRDYMEEVGPLLKNNLYSNETKSIHNTGIFVCTVGHTVSTSSEYSSEWVSQHKEKYFHYASFTDNVMRSPGESDLKATLYIHPSHGQNYIIRTDDTDLIPILLITIQRWFVASLRDAKINSASLDRTDAFLDKHLPVIWLDRTCNFQLSVNTQSRDRYINVTEIWKYLHKKGVAIEHFILIVMLKRTDYVIPFDKLNDPGSYSASTDDENGANPGIASNNNGDATKSKIKAPTPMYGAKDLFQNVMSSEEFKECLSVTQWAPLWKNNGGGGGGGGGDNVNSIVKSPTLSPSTEDGKDKVNDLDNNNKTHYRFSESRFGRYLFLRYKSALKKAVLQVAEKNNNTDNIVAKGLESRLETSNTYLLLSQIRDTINNIASDKKYTINLPLPTGRTATSNIRRMAWNLEYWINFHSSSDKEYRSVVDEMAECALFETNASNQKVSLYGWKLERVSPLDINPSDILQVSLPVNFSLQKVDKSKPTNIMMKGGTGEYKQRTTRAYFSVCLANEVTLVSPFRSNNESKINRPEVHKR